MKHARSLSANEILELIFIHLTEVSALRNHDDIISVLANMGRALTNSDRCTVWIVSDDKKKIWTKVAHGIDAIEIPIDSGIVGAAIMNEEKIILEAGDVIRASSTSPTNITATVSYMEV